MINYQTVLEEVEKTAIVCGRNPKEITVVAVSKYCTTEQILEAYQQGCRNFGESRLQEALQKIPNTPHGIKWHMVGHLQMNKVQKTIGNFILIHSVDSFKLAEKISKCSEEQKKISHILLEINTSGEVSKHGFTKEQIEQDIEKILSLPNISVDGFMTMAPFIQDEKVIRNCFANLRILRDTLQIQTKKSLPHLSMGMSNDFPIAIQEGATLLRIGTAIFTQ